MNNKLNVLTLDQSIEWDKIVRSFQNYDVYYLSGYVKAFEIHGDGKPLLFYYNENSNNKNLRAINVVMKRDIAEDPHFKNKIPPNKYFDFSTPYGYGGWLIEGSNSEQLFIDYEEWCLNNNIVSEFVRFHPILKNNIECKNAYVIVSLGETIAMELLSEEKIWNNLTSKNRNVIRKAKKNGIKIYNGRYPGAFKRFYELYNKTMTRDNAEEYYFFKPEFYISILEDLPQNVQIFYAQLPNNLIIAASIILTANSKMNYHLSGSLKEYSSFAATNLLLYQAALWGCENGYTSLYLGGGVNSDEDNLFKFKKAFYKGPLHRFYIGKKIIMSDVYKKLLDLRGIKEDETSYFPKYRANF